MSDEPALRPLDPRRSDEAIALFARAFIDDPSLVYALPDAATRERKLRWIYGRLVAIGRDVGEVEALTRGAELVAAASWLPPGARVGVGALVRAGILGLPLRVGARASARLLELLRYMERTHAALMGTRPHWYLDQFAVDPRHQGRGYGRLALARSIDARLARAPAAILLFTAKEQNLGFYRGAGFETVCDAWLGRPGDGYRIWGMIREA